MLYFEDVGVPSFISGKLVSFWVCCWDTPVAFFHKDPAHVVQRRYLPIVSPSLWLFSHESPYRGLSCASVFTQKWMLFQTQRCLQNGMWKITSSNFQYISQNFQYPFILFSRRGGKTQTQLTTESTHKAKNLSYVAARVLGANVMFTPLSKVMFSGLSLPEDKDAYG